MDKAPDLSTCGYESRGRGDVKGTYHRVQSKSSGNVYIVKILGQSMMSPEWDVGVESVKEIDIAFRVKHPHIMQGIKFLSTRTCKVLDGRFGVFFPVVDGSVRKLHGRMPSAQRLMVIHQIASALTFLHSEDIVFPGLTLDTVLLNEDGNAVIGVTDAWVYSRTYKARDDSVELDPNYYYPEETEKRMFGWEEDLFRFGLFCFLLCCETTAMELFTNPQNKRAMVKRLIRIAKGVSAEEELELELSNMGSDAALVAGIVSTCLSSKGEEAGKLGKILASLEAKRGEKIPAGTTLNLTSKPALIDKKVIEYGLDFMKLLAGYSYGILTVEQVLLTMDIYYRTAISYEKLKGDEKYDRRNYNLLAGVCARLATKLVPGKRRVWNSFIYDWCGLDFDGKSAYMLNTVEANIIEILNGVLYRRFLFHRCETLTQLAQAFEELKRQDYLSINASAWEDLHTPPPDSTDLITGDVYMRDLKL